jgi:hypothetical protein
VGKVLDAPSQLLQSPKLTLHSPWQTQDYPVHPFAGKMKLFREIVNFKLLRNACRNRGILFYYETKKETRKNYFKKNIGIGDQVASSYFVVFISFKIIMAVWLHHS